MSGPTSPHHGVANTAPTPQVGNLIHLGAFMRAVFAAILLSTLSAIAVNASTVPPPTGTGQATSARPPAHPLTREDAEAYFDGFFPDALSRAQIAGAVVVVVKDGKILLEKGYGYADVDARKPVDPARTLF